MPGFFEYIASGKENGSLTAAWILEGENAGSAAVFRREMKGYFPVFREESFPEDAEQEICGIPPERTGVLETTGGRVFLERLPGQKKLVICGAGHVAQSLIRLCRTLDYEITVTEDREEYAEKAREAGAHRVICRPFGEALDEMDGDFSTAFVIMTREHVHDMECLKRILGKNYAYAGMMGSRSRTAQIREELLAEGFDSGKTEALHMPIGLPIGSRTPEEIAVSVAAELISVLNASESGEGFPPGMAEELAATSRGVLAMIVEKNGEAPRKPGTKMLVRSDGSALGTIGGGSAEAAILRTAKKMIRDGERESRLIRISMKKGTMYCGGEITVFLMPLENGQQQGREKGKTQ